MKTSSKDTTPDVGLLANGASGSWKIAIDESLSGAAQCYAEIEGPSVYLYFELSHLGIVQKAIAFLERRASPRDDELILGAFGGASVSLVGDDEFQDRCFLVVGPKDNACVRLSVIGEDVKMLLEALRQVRDDLPVKE